jgi:hypothetical protein
MVSPACYNVCNRCHSNSDDGFFVVFKNETVSFFLPFCLLYILGVNLALHGRVAL